ncbi:hypothetical protein N8J89_16175 [Crossiella sp. CA-258035]|uniref:hypothetical protein n=1 Tax=Crossiella sp. CA-258035 TaxID=2981138 RepID=UPI0024BC1ED3|nr:hypothetical protein [Crossiella sp. CA-258035]WHT22537.1 hypothetical protein N8J89_16175 [Crossiella sp. CA-258035]
MDSPELDLFGDPVEQAQELLYYLDGALVPLRVRRDDLLRCLSDDLEQLERLEVAMAVTARQLRPSTALPGSADGPRRRAVNQVLENLAATTAVLFRLHTLVHTQRGNTAVLAAAAAAHQVLHGRLGCDRTDPLAFTGPPLGLPARLPLLFAALTTLRESAANLAAGRGHGGTAQEVFEQDLRRLRRWAEHDPQLRAPDQLEPVPGAPDRLHQVRWAPRPATPRLSEHVEEVCDYETLSAEQLTLIHRMLRTGQGPVHTAGVASTHRRRLEGRDAVISAARFGIWVQQSLLAGRVDTWISEALGLAESEARDPKRVQEQIRRQVVAGGELRKLSSSARARALRIDSAWLDPGFSGVPPDAVRLFAALYSPVVGGWYQIVRGDVHDLLGLTPMRQVHYAALIGHLADGGTLSDFASLQGRRYRDVLLAWQEMVDYAGELNQLAELTATAIGGLPRRLVRTEVRGLRSTLDAIMRGLATLNMRAPEIDEADRGVLLADEDALACAYLVLYRRLSQLVPRLRVQRVPRDPAQWGLHRIREFYLHHPLTWPTAEDEHAPRADCIATIREQVRRLLRIARPGTPGTALELLTELHHALATALRTSGEPRLPGYWDLRLEHGGQHRHVWETFQRWPGIVTVVTSAKTLIGAAKQS